MLDDGKAEPCPAEFAGPGGINAVEPLPEARNEQGRDSRAGVFYRNFNEISVKLIVLG